MPADSAAPLNGDGMQELVSVIVTSYNHAEYLDQRMISLLQQTYGHLEIIVIDDGSTDGSVQVLEKYKKYPHITIVALAENTGYAHASNLGVSLSRGAYIMFAECDDYDDPRHIEILVETMQGNEDIGVSYCRSNMVDNKGQIFGTDFQYRNNSFKRRCVRDTIIPRKDMQRYLLMSCVVPNMSAALIRKTCFEHVGGISTSYRACADWDFWCRMAEHFDFYYVAATLNDFRTHPTTVRTSFGVVLPVTEIMTLLYRSFRKTELSAFDRFRFRINVGFIWVNYIAARPRGLFRNFMLIWRHSIKYERASIVFFFLGLYKKMYYVYYRLLENMKHAHR